MSDYSLTGTDTVIRNADHAFIPNDPANVDRAEYEEWHRQGGIPDPYVAPEAVPSFLARDLMAQFTPDDYTAILTAVDASAPLGLLWASLLAQGDAPISASSERFLQGWVGLSAALGSDRAQSIAAALDIPG